MVIETDAGFDAAINSAVAPVADALSGFIFYSVNVLGAELPLMRWRVSDDEYRVIFGDLHVETVSADTLATLEAALPKEGDSPGNG